jgi:hypothetical protein
MQETSIFFKSAAHRTRFMLTMQRLGKIYENGKLDPEYAAALYVLTADSSTWNKSQEYISTNGIDIPTMLEEIDFSGGFTVLIEWAGNLFNGQQHIDPLELLRLDEENFQVALSSLLLRRGGFVASDFTIV